MEDLLPKAGLLLTIFFCISPLPTLFTAMTSDKNAIKSMSLPGVLMGMSCAVAVGSFCSMKGMTDCLTSCYINMASCMLALLVICYLNRDLFTLAISVSLYCSLSLAILTVFSASVTDLIILVLNTLACVTFPLDTLNKVLKSKDAGLINAPMHVFGTLNSFIWFLYTF